MNRARFIAVLAAAYAEVGEFQKAVEFCGVGCSKPIRPSSSSSKASLRCSKPTSLIEMTPCCRSGLPYTSCTGQRIPIPAFSAGDAAIGVGVIDQLGSPWVRPSRVLSVIGANEPDPYKLPDNPTAARAYTRQVTIVDEQGERTVDAIVVAERATSVHRPTHGRF